MLNKYKIEGLLVGVFVLIILASGYMINKLQDRVGVLEDHISALEKGALPTLSVDGKDVPAWQAVLNAITVLQKNNTTIK